MELKHATPIAKGLKAELEPYCDRIEIAGSIRRRRPEVGDIEIVCIPSNPVQVGLFADDFARTVQQYPKIKGEPNGKYTQRLIPVDRFLGYEWEGEHIKLDLFMVNTMNWGLQLAIRTGPAAFSHRMLAMNWSRMGYKSVNGVLTSRGRSYPVRVEEDLFRLLKIDWIEPWERDAYVEAEHV